MPLAWVENEVVAIWHHQGSEFKEVSVPNFVLSSLYFKREGVGTKFMCLIVKQNLYSCLFPQMIKPEVNDEQDQLIVM